MPSWLRVIAQINPLTYLVDALRGLMIVGGESVHGYGTNFGVLWQRWFYCLPDYPSVASSYREWLEMAISDFE